MGHGLGSLQWRLRDYALTHESDSRLLELRGMKSLSRTFVLRPEPNQVWTALVHRFGLPALPEWAEPMTRILEKEKRIVPVDSIGCSAVLISATCEELLEWMAVGVRRGEFTFPESNGPVR